MQRLVAFKHFFMKNLFFIITLLSSMSLFGQCVNLYVKEHFSGDPICRLSSGSTLEICFDKKTVSGGACDFYILNVRNTSGGMNIDLALDNVSWAPKYAELMINTNTQNFGFIIDNNSGAYSYYNEAEMKQMKDSDAINKRKLDEQRKLEDENTVNKINKALEEKKYFLAYNLLNDLSFENNSVSAQVLEKWNPLKQELDNLYKSYLIDFELKKTYLLEDYKINSEDFINKNKADISIVNKNFQGFKNINDAINKGVDLNNYVFYGKINDNHLVLPMAFEFHFYSNILDSIDANNVILKTGYNQVTSEIEPLISFYRDNKLYRSFNVINSVDLKVNSMEIDFSDNLNQKISDIISQGGQEYIEKYFKKKSIIFDSEIILPFNSKVTSKPKDGYQNPEFNNLFSDYTKLANEIKRFQYLSPGLCPILFKSVSYKFFLSPNLVSQIQKLKQSTNSDSIIMIFANGLPKISKTITLEQKDNGFETPGNFYFIPLKKGLFEIFNNSYIRVYNSSGNYKDLKIDKVCETYTDAKLQELVSISSHLKKHLKKNCIDYLYVSFSWPNKEVVPESFRFSDNIFIPKYSLYDYSQYILGNKELKLPKPHLFTVVVNK